jgi:hypothetical protein
VTDIIDGPLSSGQPAGDELPTAERQASSSSEESHTADAPQSANHSGDTKPIIIDPAAIPLRQRLASAVPGREKPARHKTLVLGTEALLSGPLSSGSLTSRVLASGALAPELQAPEAAASATVPGEAAADAAAPAPEAGGGAGAEPVSVPAPRTVPGSSPEPVPSQGQPPAVVPGSGVQQGPVLPLPPQDDEKYRYIRRGAWILTLASLASFPLLLFSQTRLMLQFHWFWLYVPFVIMGALFLALPMITDGLARGFDFKAHQRLVDAWRPEKYPSVDVFLPVCGEPVDVVRNTWKYVAEMSHHYQGTVTAYVLDDSASSDLKAMAREFGFAYARRPWLVQEVRKPLVRLPGFLRRLHPPAGR